MRNPLHIAMYTVVGLKPTLLGSDTCQEKCWFQSELRIVGLNAWGGVLTRLCNGVRPVDLSGCNPPAFPTRLDKTAWCCVALKFIAHYAALLYYGRQQSKRLHFLKMFVIIRFNTLKTRDASCFWMACGCAPGN